MELAIALLALTAMEIVLGIDNIVFIAVLSDRLPPEQRSKGRKLGLIMALGTRLLLLGSLSWIMGMTEPAFTWTSLGAPESWFMHGGELNHELMTVSWKDLVLLGGGMFLIYKTTKEIHEQTTGGHHEHAVHGNVTLRSVVMQIAILDIVFSLDSVITAVGMVGSLPIMITAVIIAVGVMVLFADRVSAFVSKHPTLKMLALSFLMLIGVMLVAEGVGTHIEKGYIYFAMAFSLIVEMLNMRVRKQDSHAGHQAASGA